MKKLFTLLFVGLSLLSYAQNFQLTDPKGDTCTNEQKIFVAITEDDIDPDLEYYILEIGVQNLTENSLEISTLRTNLVLMDGVGVEVCFGACFPDDVFDINYEVEGESRELYSLHLAPNGNFGLNQFKLEFWSEPDQVDKVTLFIDIDMRPVGIKENNNASVSLSASPNPAPVNSTIYVSYTLPAQSDNHRLIISNIMGAVVMNLPLNPYGNHIVIDAVNLKPGVYFYAIENKNQISIAKKLIVK